MMLPAASRGAGVPEFQERMMRSPQMMTSPWLPTVFVLLAHSVQLTISDGSSGSDTSTRRKPAYVPCTAVLPQKARSELKTPLPGTVLSVGTTRAEYPSGCMFFVYVNVLVASPTVWADALSGTATAASTNVQTMASLRRLLIGPPVRWNRQERCPALPRPRRKKMLASSAQLPLCYPAVFSDSRPPVKAGTASPLY